MSAKLYKNLFYLNSHFISFYQNILFTIFIISCFIPNHFFSKAYVTLSFFYLNNKTGDSSPDITTPKDYFESLINYTAFTTIKINNKDIKFFITLDRFTTYISEDTAKQIFESNYNDEGKSYSLEHIGIYRAKLKSNVCSFLINDTKNIINNNFTFFIVTQMNNSSDFEIKRNALATKKEEIGLNIVKGNKYKTVDYNPYDPYDPYSDFDFLSTNLLSELSEDYVYKNDGYTVEEKTNIISQLKSKDLISSYTFSIKFDNKNEEKGRIIIGGFPHEIDKKHYNEKFFIYDNIYVAPFYYNWHYEFKDIIYNGEKLPWVKEAEFSMEFGFILSTDNYKNYLDKIFFKNIKYADYCKEEKVGGYFVKYCQENVIKNFGTIYFYLSNTYLREDQTNYIEFNYKDLFVKDPGDNNLYYFEMIFENYSYRWIFGRPLFKKYQTVFDQEKKIMGFYTETGDYNSEEDINNQKDNKNEWYKSFSWILLIIIFVLIILFIIIAIILYKKLSFFRKKKANELEDDYDYSPASEINN